MEFPWKLVEVAGIWNQFMEPFCMDCLEIAGICWQMVVNRGIWWNLVENNGISNGNWLKLLAVGASSWTRSA